MRRWDLRHYVINSCVTAALLAGCGGSPPPIGTPGAMPQARTIAPARTGMNRMTTSSYRVVHRFAYTRDGGRPAGSLIDMNGKLYGTTEYGGGGPCSINGEGTGCGTVYRLDPKSGRKKVLYTFRGGSSDGAYPNGELINVNGTLYGTTEYGGSTVAYGFGTVYSISSTGKETVLHSFRASTDGANPLAGLVDVNGTLYGTTSNDGACAFCGTVYSITTSGSFSVLHDFGSGSDGAYAFAGLIDVKGTLYGTTVAGGSSHNGTVFSITPTGTERVLYSFANSPDGANPLASLIDVHGTLYGTTINGGVAYCENVGVYDGCGTVYSVSTTGKEKVLYSFSDDPSYYPQAGLIDVNGTLYGTALGGGNGCTGNGCGVVFSVSTTGSEQTIHTFSGGNPDGAFPDATLIDIHGTLYGTTSRGGGTKCAFYGGYHLGCGTIFALTP